MAVRPPAGWFPRRGEVYRVGLPGEKVRPAAVLSTDALNRHALDVCLVAFTTVHHREFSLRIAVRRGEAGLKRDSWAKCDQVHAVEKAALLHPPLGRLARETLAQIEDAVRVTLELP